jgi:hypothetical protein
MDISELTVIHRMTLSTGNLYDAAKAYSPAPLARLEASPTNAKLVNLGVKAGIKVGAFIEIEKG